VDGATGALKKEGLSQDECAKACIDDSKCEAAEYVKPARVCNLFNTLPKIVASPLGANTPIDVAAKRKPTKATAAEPSKDFSMHENFDIVGGDAKRMELVDHDACMKACHADPACRGYSYDKWNRWCFLKDDVSRIRLEPNTVSAIRSSLGQPSRISTLVKMHRYRNRAFPWTGQDSARADTLDECEARCQASESCVAATFFRASKQCRLMAVAGEPTPDQKADSVVKRQEPES
jgi:hypothetical protein